MSRFYFDIHEGDEATVDEAGLELPDIAAAQKEAVCTLSEIARDAVRGHFGHGECNTVSIEVRNDEGPVLEASFAFGITAKGAPPRH